MNDNCIMSHSDSSSNLGLIIFTFLCLVSRTDIHGSALDALALWCTNDGGVHREELAVVIEEDGWGQLNDTRHQRWLDKLEVELAS